MITKRILSSHEEWLANRQKGIGGSEISAIVGLNPYMTNLDLWELKTGRQQAEDISDKPYVKFGTEAEEHLRALFALDFPQYEVLYEENNSFINDKYPWGQASLDGWLIEKETGRKGILEIKTTNILQSMQKEKWKDRIPNNYYCQVLFYMAMLEADFAILKARLKSEFAGNIYAQIRHYTIERADVEEDIEMLMAAGEKFWNENVLANKRPALLLPEI